MKLAEKRRSSCCVHNPAEQARINRLAAPSQKMALISASIHQNIDVSLMRLSEVLTSVVEALNEPSWEWFAGIDRRIGSSVRSLRDAGITVLCLPADFGIFRLVFRGK